MRKFWIENQDGVQKDLQTTDVFYHQPNGLGMTNECDYLESGDFFIQVKDNKTQMRRGGSFVFMPPNAYTKYRTFTDWLMKSTSLTLVYQAVSDKFKQDVEIASIEKGELSEGGYLECPVEFVAISPIYSSLDLNINVEGETGYNIKKYPYKYTYKYANTAVAGEVKFTSDSQLASDFMLTMTGPIVAPIVTVKRLDTNETIGKIDLSAASANTGETLIYSTVPTVAGAKKVTTNSTTDLTDLIGISDVPTFFKMPANVQMLLKIEASSLLGLACRLKVYRYYRTV